MAEVMVHENDRTPNAELLPQDAPDRPSAPREARRERHVIGALQEREASAVERERSGDALDESAETPLAFPVLEQAVERAQLVDEELPLTCHHDGIQLGDIGPGKAQRLADRTPREPHDQLQAAEPLLVDRGENAFILDDRGPAVSLGADTHDLHLVASSFQEALLPVPDRRSLQALSK